MGIDIIKIKRSELGGWLPWPAADANKYTRGFLVVVGGAPAYPGAVCLASTAGMRMGSGYVEVVCSPEALPVVHAYNPNLVAHDWRDWHVRGTRLAEPNDGRHPCACLVGPGFDARSKEQRSLVLSLLSECVCPLVVDGGALAVLATDEGRALAERRHRRSLPLMVTPHFGEAARLAEPLGINMPPDPSRMRREDAELAQALARAYGATVTLKGSDTFIASCDEDCEGEKASYPIALMTRGTAVLAKAGTGDVLAGMTASLASQGLSPWKAANLAANLHAYAGRCAGKSHTEICACAEDLIDALPEAIAHFAR